MTLSHYVPESSQGETCHKCRKEPAKHKVAELMPEIYDVDSIYNRHPLTAYLCCNCFGDLMGGLAGASCKADNKEDTEMQNFEMFTANRFVK